MRNLDTEITGTPAAIRSIEAWLRQDLKTGFDDFGEEVNRQRRSAGGDWQGETATAFAGRTQTLVGSADDGVTVTGKVATLVGDLADDLMAAQGDMQSVRGTARTGGLDVVGFVVQNPGGGPAGAGQSPGPDATPHEAAAWEERNQAVVDHNAKVEVWGTCVELANEAWLRWQAALEAGARSWTEHDVIYFGLSGQFLSVGAQLDLVRRATPILAGEVDDLLTSAAELRNHAALIGAGDRVAPVDRAHYYDLLKEADRLEDSHPARARGLSNWELPKGLTRGLWAIDVATAGYGIYSDWDDEGPAQAITSNAVPAVTSIAAAALAGAATGAVVGSFIPVPGVGTAFGIVVGAGFGAAVGVFTSGAVDSLFDSGADTLGDWGDAVVDGRDDVKDLFSPIGDGIDNAFDAIF